MRDVAFLAAFALSLLLAFAPHLRAEPPHEALETPRLVLPPSDGLRVALTFDACDGATDMRILDVLLAERIPATIFVTGKWLRRNGEALALLRAHPDLFEIENHGANHLAAVDHPRLIFGQKSAGSPAAVRAEIEGGAAAMHDADLPAPRWFRGATAEYTASAIRQIETLGLGVAGFSLNGDQGASLGAPGAQRRIAAARDGDVVIAHINQPKRAAGQGVAAGILALKARGASFVRLADVLGQPPSGASR